jgi:hypothetical protein
LQWVCARILLVLIVLGSAARIAIAIHAGLAAPPVPGSDSSECDWYRAVAFAAVIAYASLSWPFSRSDSEIEAPAGFASRKRKLQSTVQAQLEKFGDIAETPYAVSILSVL